MTNRLSRRLFGASLAALALMGSYAAASAQDLNALVWCDHTDPALIEQVHRNGPVDTDAAIVLHTSGTTRTPRSSACSTASASACAAARDSPMCQVPRPIGESLNKDKVRVVIAAQRVAAVRTRPGNCRRRSAGSAR